MTYPLPYSFARAHQLLLEDDGQRLCLTLSDASDRSALSEVTRKFAGQGLQLLPCTPAELAQRIHQAYSGGQAHGASMAAAVVNEV
jgi:general secretion pathway protein E